MYMTLKQILVNSDYILLLSSAVHPGVLYKPTAQSHTHLPMNKGVHCVYH